MHNYKKWQTLASKYLVNDRWLKLRADKVETPDGHTLDPFYVFEYPNWINCLVIDENNNAVMIRQYRHGAEEYVLEIVGGSVESHDADTEDSIQRELQEELGYVGGEIILTGISYANPANQNNKIYSYLAIGGSCSEDQALEPGENIYVEKIPFQELVSLMTRSGNKEIFQSYNLANILFAINHIKKSDNPRLQELANLL